MNKREPSPETRSERRLARKEGNAPIPAAPSQRLTPNTQRLTPAQGLSLWEKSGLIVLWLALFLAPAIGGFPAGATYTADTSLNVLRLLILLAGGILLFASPAKHTAGIGRTATYALWATSGLTLLSLLIHSRFFASDVLLFAMLPATLDWLCFGVVFAVTMRYAGDTWAQRGTVIALILGASWAALTAVDSYVGPLSALAGSERNYLVAYVAWFIRLSDVILGAPASRAQGSFFSPNFLAGLLTLLLPLAAASWMSATSKRAAGGFGIASALIVAALFATGSRSGIALAFGGLIVTLGLYLFARRGAKLPWTRLAVILAVVLVVAVAFRGPITQRVEGGASQDHSGAFRSWTWRGTQAMAQANPFFGTGPGTFPYLYSRYAQVARTDLAHSSYLQVAAEQGFPALLVIGLALVGVFGAAGRNLRSVKDDDRDALLLCALTGGLLASVIHNAFDSEWALLGNALPFWSVAGLVAGRGSPGPEGNPVEFPLRRATHALRPVLGLGLLAAFVVSVLLLRGAQYRDEVLAQVKSASLPEIKLNGWPPDPTLFYNAGKLEETARIEPTGRRFYQLARLYAGQKNVPRAVEALKESLKAEPTSLQAWRKMAETQERAGDHAAALDAWRELIKLQEGPVGQYRAIPELPETHAAFAYVALARNAAAQGQNDPAKGLYEKAASVIEEYSHTNKTYQEMELANTQVSGVNIAARRQELADLYAKVIAEWSGLAPDKATELASRRDATLKRLSEFLLPGSSAAPQP